MISSWLKWLVSVGQVGRLVGFGWSEVSNSQSVESIPVRSRMAKLRRLVGLVGWFVIPTNT